ncbi:hypothetical protein R3I93_001349 [Phoxinus phoxinus]|uniref:Uncharacterized protein n=1 Tax=Phoxinus phoxinus TaxID=58324 RepID=A0AAN9DK90_9TELE
MCCSQSFTSRHPINNCPGPAGEVTPLTDPSLPDRLPHPFRFTNEPAESPHGHVWPCHLLIAESLEGKHIYVAMFRKALTAEVCILYTKCIFSLGMHQYDFLADTDNR